MMSPRFLFLISHVSIVYLVKIIVRYHPPRPPKPHLLWRKRWLPQKDSSSTLLFSSPLLSLFISCHPAFLSFSFALSFFSPCRYSVHLVDISFPLQVFSPSGGHLLPPAGIQSIWWTSSSPCRYSVHLVDISFPCRYSVHLVDISFPLQVFSPSGGHLLPPAGIQSIWWTSPSPCRYSVHPVDISFPLQVFSPSGGHLLPLQVFSPSGGHLLPPAGIQSIWWTSPSPCRYSVHLVDISFPLQVFSPSGGHLLPPAGIQSIWWTSPSPCRYSVHPVDISFHQFSRTLFVDWSDKNDFPWLRLHDLVV
ncbi:uncharacterized protein LOC135507563 [Oncorhynchus masou masou]|uniref:uncharacterized protein LOC135507563 n=1 Tax=Oncorhynchus masou masou TaxID=90313 RepID=UPI0031840489